jgi:CRISPR-associated protein Cas2
MLPLVLCAYDVADPRRLAAALHAVTGWSHGGQRSVFECFPARREASALARAVAAPLRIEVDRLGLFRPAREGGFTLGLGAITRLRPVVYVG